MGKAYACLLRNPFQIDERKPFWILTFQPTYTFLGTGRPDRDSGRAVEGINEFNKDCLESNNNIFPLSQSEREKTVSDREARLELLATRMEQQMEEMRFDKKNQ